MYDALETAGDRPWKTAGTAASCALVLSVLVRPEIAVAALPIVLALAGLAAAVGARLGRRPLEGPGATLVGIAFPGLGIAHLVAIGTLDGGFGYLVFLYALVEINDVVAYLVGGAIGRHKIWPSLSPKKTVEGSLAGAVACVVLAFPLSFTVPDLSASRILFAAVLLAVAGRPATSWPPGFKRRAEIKDYGALIPTQGGVLDVYDSVVAVSPLFYYYLRLSGS